MRLGAVVQVGGLGWQPPSPQASSYPEHPCPNPGPEPTYQCCWLLLRIQAGSSRAAWGMFLCPPLTPSTFQGHTPILSPSSGGLCPSCNFLLKSTPIPHVPRSVSVSGLRLCNSDSLGFITFSAARSKVGHSGWLSYVGCSLLHFDLQRIHIYGYHSLLHSVDCRHPVYAA